MIIKEIDNLDANFLISPRIKSNQIHRIKELEQILIDTIQKEIVIYFTRAEKEVIEEVKLQKNNKGIAEDLGISENTVKTLKSRALRRAKAVFSQIKISNTEELIGFLESNKIGY